MLRSNNTAYANEIKIRGPFNPFYPSPVHPCFPRIRSRANEDLMETAPVPRLTDLKGTLNYLAANAVIYVVVGCLSNTEHRLVNEKSPARSRGLTRTVYPDSFTFIYYYLSPSLVRLIWTSWCIHAQFSNIIRHIDGRFDFVEFSFFFYK